MHLTPDDLPEVDLWVAGFPCQPFSSSGSRLGFGHRSGNVFEHLSRLIRERRPRIVVLENVEGLLTNKSGHTFATILQRLTDLRYAVHWLVINLRWHRVPQSRPRLFMIAADNGALHVPGLREMPVCRGTRFRMPGENSIGTLLVPNGGGGPAGLHIRDEALSHCIGTSLGGTPLFAVPIVTVATRHARDEFLAFSNWHREQDGMLIMRLRPDRSVLLFGPHTDGLCKALEKWEAGATRKFKLVGNMVAPICSSNIASIFDEHTEIGRTRALRHNDWCGRGEATRGKRASGVEATQK